MSRTAVTVPTGTIKSQATSTGGACASRLRFKTSTAKLIDLRGGPVSKATTIDISAAT
jgi:hypothetical protein